MLVEIGQALHFLNVLIVHAIPALGELHLPFPPLRVGERVFEFQRGTVVHHLDPLDDVQFVARGHAGVDPVVVAYEVLRVHDQGVLFPPADRFAVEAAHDDIGIGTGGRP